MVRNTDWMTLDGSLRLLREIHGAKFTDGALAPQFRPYYAGPRVEVRTTYSDGTTHTRRGRVGITTGHTPVFLLLPRRDSRASSDVLGPNDEIIRVIPDWWSRKWGAQHFPIHRAR
jgi:hypothetical protein